MGGNNTSKLHHVCRREDPAHSKLYQNIDDSIPRLYVSNDTVSWEVEWPEYESEVLSYTSKTVLDQPVWADSPNSKDISKWNSVDGKTDRRSHMGKYKIVDGVPLNSKGRTGMRGRGRLGKWGPNHAADPIVTRWKLDENGEEVKHPETKQKILQFISVKRNQDTSEWSIPGCICEPDKNVLSTIKFRFMEKAVSHSVLTRTEELDEELEKLFKKGKQIYKGYVDDPRNTDNAWMETIVYNFHIDNKSKLRGLEFEDDGNIKWIDIDSKLDLFASHEDFIDKVRQYHKAHW